MRHVLALYTLSTLSCALSLAVYSHGTSVGTLCTSLANFTGGLLGFPGRSYRTCILLAQAGIVC